MIMNKLVPITLAAAACLLLVSAETYHEFADKYKCERLPSNVVPTKYDLTLRFPSLESSTFDGHMNISFKFASHKDSEYEQLAKGLLDSPCKPKEPNNKIVLHFDRKYLRVRELKFWTESCTGLAGCFGSANSEKEREIGVINYDDSNQMFGVRTWKSWNTGTTGKLSIRFTGDLRDDKRGVYVSSFKNGDQKHKYIVSQFQPTDARTAFPVLDEPRFKVPFQVNIIHPRGLTALANTEAELVEDVDKKLVMTKFKETPPMSVHMLAFTVGKFDEPLEVEAKSSLPNSPSYKVRVFTAPGLRESGHFALEVAKGSLENFEKYINYPYPLEKFDIVAIADHDKDNTESWGLSFIRDTLVWIDDETKPDTKITTAVNVAHVCVHQWFANLVTAAWWNDLWITEGVAAQFAFKIVRELYPEFESEYFVRLATLSGVMQLDAAQDVHSLSPPREQLKTSAQIYGLFDNVEFMKSASLAQTMNKWLDRQKENWYQEVLRSLVEKFAYKTVSYADYIEAIETFGHGGILYKKISLDDIKELIESLKSRRGVPVINAKLVGSTHKVDIEYMATARKIMSYGPGKLRTAAIVWEDFLIERDNEKDNEEQGRTFEPMRPLKSFQDGKELERSVAKLDDNKPKYVKVGATPDINAYYRARYHVKDYESFCEPIKAGQLSAMDRLHILDDATALVNFNLLRKIDFRELVNCYENEQNGAVLIQLLTALKSLAHLQLTSPSVRAIMNIFKTHGFSVSGKETFLEQRSRQVGLKALVDQGIEEVIEAALKTFDDTQGNVALFLREPVYAAVVAKGSEAQMEVLLAKMRATKSHEEKVRLATALSFATNKKYLDQWFDWLKNHSDLKAEITKPLVDKMDQNQYLKMWW